MENIDVKKLQQCFQTADADLRASYRIIQNLESENNHLRQVIEMLITKQSPNE